MSEEAVKEGRGVQAYRWLLVGGMCLLAVLSTRVLNGVDKTAEKVDALQLQFTVMQGSAESRFNAHSERFKGVDDRNTAQDQRMDRQDLKLDAFRDRLYSTGGPKP